MNEGRNEGIDGCMNAHVDKYRLTSAHTHVRIQIQSFVSVDFGSWTTAWLNWTYR